MATLQHFLFPSKLNDKPISLLLLAFRLLFGSLLMYHGIGKLMNFETLATTFPNPLGMGSEMSLILAIFAELFCSLMFIIGILYRLVLLPMIFTLSIAFFVIHSGGAFATKELAFIYLAVFVIMYIAGPGKYSADALIAKYINKSNDLKVV